MIHYKKFTLYAFTSIALYLLFHFVVWNIYSKKIFGLSDKEAVGDLARLSYRTEILHKRALLYTLPKSHIFKKSFKNQKLDMITIGDSFSYGGGFGKNPFYQDFLASQYNINILNVGTKNLSEYIEAAINLHNSGFFKKHPTKYLLLESVVHLNLGRYARDIKWNYHSKIIIQGKMTNIYHQDIKFLNPVNYKVIIAKIEHNILHKKCTNGICKFQTTKALFTPNRSSLLIYYPEIESLPGYTATTIALINKNMNKLANILKTDGVQLIFMPVVDKYDLYYPYLKNNPYPKNPYFDLLRKEKKEYLFIDTKEILSKLLKEGVQDVFYIDDTHWSDKASQAISNSAFFKKLFNKKRVQGKIDAI